MLLTLLFVLVPFVSAEDTTYGTTLSPDAPQYVDRQCAGDLNNLWLEVVAVVDNSKGMTSEKLNDIAANIASVFSADTKIGTHAEPRSTRVGLVTYNAQATVAANLDQYQSIDDLYDGVFTALSTVSTTDESYLANGLSLAETLFEQGKQSHPERAHYQKVVIVYASAYKGDGTSLNPVPVADRLKTSGVTIVTVAYDQDGDGALLVDLAKIATPHDNFANTDFGGNTIGEIQGALLQANCFCPNGWIQYRTDFTDVFSHRYGVCIQPVGLTAVWKAARLSCRNRWPNSFLTTEFDQNKHDFVLKAMTNVVGAQQPYNYHIGLNLITGVWQWEQPVGVSTLPQQSYSPWNPGYPLASSSWTGVLNLQPGSSQVSTGWQNINPMTTSANYVCEVASCDTANYCASVDSTH